MKTLGNYINGKWVSDQLLAQRDVFNPAVPDIKVGKVQWANPALAAKAADAAAVAWDLWKKTNLSKRVQLCKKVLVEITKSSEKLARIITAENGKTLLESGQEIDSASM